MIVVRQGNMSRNLCLVAYLPLASTSHCIKTGRGDSPPGRLRVSQSSVSRVVRTQRISILYDAVTYQLPCDSLHQILECSLGGIRWKKSNSTYQCSLLRFRQLRQIQAPIPLHYDMAHRNVSRALLIEVALAISEITLTRVLHSSKAQL